MKNYHVKINFTFDEENSIFCEFDIEADSFSQAEFEAAKFIAGCFELCTISEVVE